MATKTYEESIGASALVAEFQATIEGKVILVTGTSPGGLGAFFVRAVAMASPALLILANRNVDKAQETAAAIANINPAVRTRILRLDLESFASVRAGAEEVKKYSEDIDVLVNNAGIMAVPYSKTQDGFERQWQTNFLGPFFFTNLIMDKLLTNPRGCRVVNVSTEAYACAHVRHNDWHFHVSSCPLYLLPCVESLLMMPRTANRTSHGSPTAPPRPPSSCTRKSWRGGLAVEASQPSVCVQVPRQRT
jgi:NAD(P)-dependent dehydrogenase (short-subunit alcohol dehydrogenase family)